MWFSRFRGICAALWLSALSLSAHAADVSSPLPTFHEGTLANGLQYTLVPLSADKGRVDIRLIVNAGSLDETTQQSGVAHMVEHMVFRASQTWPEGVGNALAKQGWKRGMHYNAMTNYERTIYMMSPPGGVKGLPQALDALNQMTRHAQILQRDLDDERKVILEEWRGKLGVAERMNQQRVAAIRDGSRYPQRPTIGTEAAIRTMPATQLQAFYQKWYHPAAMRLMIIGDIDPDNVKAQIQHQLGEPATTAQSAREEDGPELKPQLRIVRLQDSESGGSQVSLVTRFTENFGYGPEGYRDRLINQIALRVLSQQLLRQRSALPPSVGSVVARRSEIGRTAVAFALFADVTPGSHMDGVKVVYEERERLKKYGLRRDEVETERLRLLGLAKKMVDKKEVRTFSEWVYMLSTSWANNSPYFGIQARGKAAIDELESITADDVNTRVRQWLSAPDTLLQFTFPGRSTWSVPAQDEVLEIEAKAESSRQAPPSTPQQTQLPVLLESRISGSLTGIKTYSQPQVQEWQLSNGDRVVWLNTPLAKDKIWFTALSQAGFMSEDLSPWQSQLAAQLVRPGGDAVWSGEESRLWIEKNKMALNSDLQANSLTIAGQADSKQIETLFNYYQALQLNAGIDSEDMKSSLLQLSRRIVMQQASNSARKDNEITALRFGKEAFAQPDAHDLENITPDALLTQWQKTVRAPVTYFILADLPAQTLKAATQRYLAGIPRTTALPATPYLALPGKREQASKANVEPRADVRLWSFTPVNWTPAEAVQVSIAGDLIYQHLKTVLRDKARGIYNMRFSSELNDKNGRIETEIRFTTSPARARELAALAVQTLPELKISQRDIAQKHSEFIKAEAVRGQDIRTVQRRLMLSYQHFNHPYYLTQVNALADAITLSAVRDAADRLFSTENQVLYIALPQEKQK